MFFTLDELKEEIDKWKEKRIGYKDDEVGREVIDESSIKEFYIEHQLSSEDVITTYIMDCIKG